MSNPATFFTTMPPVLPASLPALRTSCQSPDRARFRSLAAWVRSNCGHYSSHRRLCTERADREPSSGRSSPRVPAAPRKRIPASTLIVKSSARIEERVSDRRSKSCTSAATHGPPMRRLLLFPIRYVATSSRGVNSAQLRPISRKKPSRRQVLAGESQALPVMYRAFVRSSIARPDAKLSTEFMPAGAFAC